MSYAQSKYSIRIQERIFNLFPPLSVNPMDSILHQRDNMFLWTPIALSLGIALYFSLSIEPPLILCLFFSLVCTCLTVLGRNAKPHIRILLLGILILSTGFTAAKIRTEFVSTPIISKKIGPVEIFGKIEQIEKMEEGDGSRLTLSDLAIENLEKKFTPKKIRLRLRADSDVKIGQTIKVLAALNPPSAPIIPDGFDFRRYLYFQSIGAVGFIYKAPEVISPSKRSTFHIEKIRAKIAHHIEKALPTRQASIALALLVGQKKSLTEEDQQALRDAGLAHMLAISGLHVGLFAGAFFFVFRFFLVLIPGFALRYPVKKIVAIATLIVALFYMMIAGSTISTQRAVLMIGVVFLAIILDRSPISLRLVAFAAFSVLLISPESLLSASFHMSFAAVTCLIYFYEITKDYWSAFYRKEGWLNKMSVYFLGVCFTTIIASIATAPFAIYHFGQVSYMGSVANLIAVPLLAFLVMPFALLSLFLMPLGLEYLPLQMVGIGIECMLEIAYWAADLPHAVIKTPFWNFMSFIVLIMGSLFFTLWKGWGKILALPAILLSAILAQQTMPTILISDTNKLFGFYVAGHDLYVSSRRSDRFIRENWEKYYGLPENSAKKLNYKGGNKDQVDFYKCGEQGCRITINNTKISFILNPYIEKQECDWADIILSVDPLPDQYRKNLCKSNISIDKFDTWGKGSHAIWVNNGTVKIITAMEKTSGRPWSAYPR